MFQFLKTAKGKKVIYYQIYPTIKISKKIFCRFWHRWCIYFIITFDKNQKYHHKLYKNDKIKHVFQVNLIFVLWIQQKIQLKAYWALVTLKTKCHVAYGRKLEIPIFAIKLTSFPLGFREMNQNRMFVWDIPDWSVLVTGQSSVISAVSNRGFKMASNK